MPANHLRVNIFGTDYALKAEDNQEYLIEVAKYVDQKMREIDRSQAISSNLKIAILAALNIADELHQTRQYQDRVIEQINEDSRKLSRSLQDALDI